MNREENHGHKARKKWEWTQIMYWTAPWENAVQTAMLLVENYSAEALRKMTK